MFKNIESVVGPNIGGPGVSGGASADDRNFVNDLKLHPFAEFAKVNHREKVQVGGIVPIIGKRAGNRSSSVQQDLDPNQNVSDPHH